MWRPTLFGRARIGAAKSRPLRSSRAFVLLSSQFWPMLSMSRGVINCAKLFLSHLFIRIKSFDQWAVDQDPFFTSTTSAKIGKTAIFFSIGEASFVTSFALVKAARGFAMLERPATKRRYTPHIPRKLFIWVWVSGYRRPLDARRVFSRACTLSDDNRTEILHFLEEVALDRPQYDPCLS